jgi:hypothetical protein
LAPTFVLLVFRCNGVGALFLAGADEFELFQLVAQGVAADVQQTRGVRLISIGLAHGEFDHGALDFFKRCAFFGDVEARQHAAVGELLASAAIRGRAASLESG